MRLTKKAALRITIELWTWLAETGRLKREWPGWETYGYMWEYCPLCEFDSRHQVSERPACVHCLIVTTGYAVHCTRMAYGHWAKACSATTRKRYAAQFLAQLKEIQEKL